MGEQMDEISLYGSLFFLMSQNKILLSSPPETNFMSVMNFTAKFDFECS